MSLHTPTVWDLWGEGNRGAVWGDSALSQPVNQQELTDPQEEAAGGEGGGDGGVTNNHTHYKEKRK